MSSLSLAETHAIAELADVFYSFLPGSGAKYTWREVAIEHEIGNLWQGGSKLPAITSLLENTYRAYRPKFCDLVLTAIRGGLKYRLKNQNPVTRDEIAKINELLLKLHFKIPELHDAAFLNTLATGGPPTAAAGQRPPGRSQIPQPNKLDTLRAEYTLLCKMTDVQARGFAFEKFLTEFFRSHGLLTSGPFKHVGEQIDGSVSWRGQVFLVEARWRDAKANAADLLVLRGKAEKAEWTRGLFISINGFSDLAAASFAIGRRANLITMDGLDLALILGGQWTLDDAIEAKMHATGETNNVHVPLASITR